MHQYRPFAPPAWLRNRHVQTLFTSSPLCRLPAPAWRREIVELPDGDFVEAAWLDETPPRGDDAVTLVLLHGLEGSSDATYARMMAIVAAERGWRLVVLHFRDCGEYPNRLPRRYHAGETGDVRFFLARLSERYPDSPLVAAGYSLGGNILLKYLGEEGESSAFRAAAAVSVPFDLQDSADALNAGVARFYRWYLLRKMKAAMKRKFTPENAPFDWPPAMAAGDFATFDDLVTAPLHGFSGKDHYYTACSCGRYLHGIRTPTLILNARDDPFMTPAAIPPKTALPDCVRLEITERGGHIGFVGGRSPWRPDYWMPGRLFGFFDRVLGETADRSAD
jgi:predicted alpha/beta-fold hydrolase